LDCAGTALHCLRRPKSWMALHCCR
jgi:hypothetical protein